VYRHFENLDEFVREIKNVGKKKGASGGRPAARSNAPPRSERKPKV
jgi:hypothetical protein